MKIQGTLVHILFVAPLGHSYIPALCRFITIFNAQSRNEFTCWHLHRQVLPELDFWLDFLSSPANPRELRERGSAQDIGISVDASTDWGIGLCWGHKWAGWRAINWSGPYRNIRWLEGVAVELVVYVLVERGFRDCCILVRSDNKGVIAAFRHGRSRNVEVNLSIRRAIALMWVNNISFKLEYVHSAENPADPISRGNLGPRNANLRCRFNMLSELADISAMHRTLSWLSAARAVESRREAQPGTQSHSGAPSSSSTRTFSWSSYLPSSSRRSTHATSVTSSTCSSFLEHFPLRFPHGTFLSRLRTTY